MERPVEAAIAVLPARIIEVVYVEIGFTGCGGLARTWRAAEKDYDPVVPEAGIGCSAGLACLTLTPGGDRLAVTAIAGAVLGCGVLDAAAIDPWNPVAKIPRLADHDSLAALAAQDDCAAREPDYPVASEALPLAISICRIWHAIPASPDEGMVDYRSGSTACWPPSETTDVQSMR